MYAARFRIPGLSDIQSHTTHNTVTHTNAGNTDITSDIGYSDNHNNIHRSMETVRNVVDQQLESLNDTDALASGK